VPGAAFFAAVFFSTGLISLVFEAIDFLVAGLVGIARKILPPEAVAARQN
jgi:hypothetical protein